MCAAASKVNGVLARSSCANLADALAGCFEAYLGAKQVNEAFPRILDSLDWLFFCDRLDSKLRSDRDDELLGYVPYAFVPWHKLFASHTQKHL